MKTSLLLSLPLLAAPALAQDAGPVTGLPLNDPVCEAILAEAAAGNQVMAHLDELVNGIGPRLTSSTACTEACEWAVQRFRDFGVPEVRMEAWGEWPVGFDRHGMRGRVVEPKKVPLVMTTRSWTPGTDGMTRGRVVAAPSDQAELDAARGSLAGTWVLLGGTRPRFGEGDSFGHALGAFLLEEGVHGTLTASRGELVTTGGNHRIEWDALPELTQVTLRRDQAKDLGAWLEEGQEVVVELDLDQEFVQGPIPLYNVIAEIPGSEKPEELVIFGGHIDSWDGATGTNDNGTGCATTMEAARLLMAALEKTGMRPKRTIRFMLWSGEEQGLWGSREYIAQHPEENDRVSGVLVHDGGTNYLSGIVATPAMLPMFEEVFAPVEAMVAGLEDPEFDFEIRTVDRLPQGIGSDHDSYVRVDVPGFFWSQAGESNYNYVHHTQHDTYDSAIARYEEHSAKIIAMTAWRLGAAEQMIPRGEAPRRLLGVRLADEALRVTGLTDGGQAAALGLLEGDLIVRVGDLIVVDRRDLSRAIRSGEPRKTITVERGGELLSFEFSW
jgi:carboxypeptidase Q